MTQKLHTHNMCRKKDVNYNVERINSRDIIWLTYLLLITGARIFYGSIPSISSGMAWAFANLIYVLATSTLFHRLKGTPFKDQD
jgi:hypothetical protein